MLFDSNIWGPHYWFFIHTIASTYPLNPNKTTKRKYYDFIINLPLFIPDEKMGNDFAELLDKYPVSPYLDNRDSFIRWTIFIHNKINKKMGKDEISYSECLDDYVSHYKTKPQNLFKKTSVKIIILILLIIIITFYMYKL